MNAGTRGLVALLAICSLLTGCVAQQHVAARDMTTSARQNPERLLVIGVRNVQQVQPGGAGSTYRGYGGDSGDYDVSDAARRALSAVATQYSLHKVAEWPIAVLQMECVVFEMPAGASRDSLLASLRADARVELAQPLQSFGTQTLEGTAAAGAAPATDSMNLQAAHTMAQGEGVRVAVVDTGLDAGHPDLAGRVEAEFDFVNASRGDSHLDRHGTAVAGIIAARPNAEARMIGIAPRARLLALKACWQLTAGRDEARCNSYTLAQALAKAIDLRAEIINLSLTGPADPLLSSLVQRAVARGIIVVGPGNAGPGPAGFPGSEPAVLTVIRSEAGAAPERNLRAPGLDVLTLAPGARYSIASGDSIATAAISGVTALLLSAQRPLRAERVQQLLHNATDTLGGEQRVVNACRALAALGSRDCVAELAAIR